MLLSAANPGTWRLRGRCHRAPLPEQQRRVGTLAVQTLAHIRKSICELGCGRNRSAGRNELVQCFESAEVGEP
eukprot:12944580-Alexandrium_andersonii.AAC.1